MDYRWLAYLNVRVLEMLISSTAGRLTHVQLLGKYVGPVTRTNATPAGGYDIVLHLDNQQYWSVPGLDEAMKPLLPPTYISAEAVRAIAAKLDPGAEWWPRFQTKGIFAVDGDFVWEATGFEPGGIRVGYYLHPVTGAILKTEPPETTAPAEAANPNPNTTEAGRKSQFLDRAVL